MPRRLLFFSTPVGPIGSGIGGGVEQTLTVLARELQRRGHHIDILAPQGSTSNQLNIIPISGSLQPSIQTEPSLQGAPETSVLRQMWQEVVRRQTQYDLLVNFAYDELPFQQAPQLSIPTAHLVSLASMSPSMDIAIRETVQRAPASLAFHSQAQAESFSVREGYSLVGGGIEISEYDFVPETGGPLAWVGRISPEKGLEDAIQASLLAKIPLQIAGLIQDPAYWQKVSLSVAPAHRQYLGFLQTPELQKILGTSRALLMTPHWLEAYGLVALEALACGTPVLTYRRGGPGEIVEDGKTGWRVESGDITGLAEATHRIPQIRRADCRKAAELCFSETAFADRVEAWWNKIINK